MKCKKCGKEINMFDAYCKHCGSINYEEIKPIKELDDVDKKINEPYDSTGYKVPKGVGNEQNAALVLVSSILAVAGIVMLLIQNEITIALSLYMSLASIILAVLGIKIYRINDYKNKCIISLVIGIICLVMYIVIN